MKKYLGQIIFNIVAAAAGAVMFTSTGILDSAATAVLGIVGLMASLCVGNRLSNPTTSSRSRPSTRSMSPRAISR